MPVLLDRGLGFVHIPKTAGTAFSRAFELQDAAYAGTGLWDLLAAHPDPGALMRSVRRNFLLASARDFPQVHLPAQALRELVGRERWTACFSVAFVRNPFDLLVSTYEFSRRDVLLDRARGADPDRVAFYERCPSFARFVELYPVMRGDMSSMLCDETNAPIVSYVGRYETLERDVERLRERFCDGPPLERVNASERRPYREYYDARTRALAERHFARDLDRFEYAF